MPSRFESRLFETDADLLAILVMSVGPSLTVSNIGMARKGNSGCAKM